jgi:hypothetical protein
MTREPDLQPEHSGSLFENYKGFGKKERPNRKQGPLFFVRILLYPEVCCLLFNKQSR